MSATTETTTASPQKRPEFVNGIRVRMPENYDFNTWGKDYSSYSKDFKLRTDAVWEKTQLKNWFRLTNKCFFFDKHKLKYRFTEPEDIYQLTMQPWGFEEEELMDWVGFTRTGVTNSFQVGLGPKQRVESTFNSFYSMPDYYIMCTMRFEKWWRCDQVYHDDRILHYDRNPERGLNLKDDQHYPCFREYHETTYACADNMIKLMIELAYAKRAQDVFTSDYSSVEINSFPSIFDSPNAPDRVTYTY